MSIISVIGLGFVGKAYLQAFSKKYLTYGVDVDDKKLEEMGQVIDGKCAGLINKNTDRYPESDYYILCLPTDGSSTSSLDTSLVELCLKEVSIVNPQARIIIKSTLPSGFCASISESYPNLIYSPEFLREDSALFDVLNPDRIVVAGSKKNATDVGELFNSISTVQGDVFITSFEEAELIKLGANSYLATRVAFFNELDSLCLSMGVRAKVVFDALCADSRIGNSYNNPSFGFGGYCLPKDTKALSLAMNSFELNLLSQVCHANDQRINFFVKLVLHKEYTRVGIYGTEMKTHSSNSRASASLELAKRLIAKGVEVYVYERSSKDRFPFLKYVNNREELAVQSEIIFANRINVEDREYFGDMLISRDIYQIG